MLAFFASSSSWLVSPTAPASAPMLATGASSRQCLRMGASADTLVSKLNDVFWETKKAQMEAEMDQKLRDLEEFRAREQALYDTLSTNALSAAPAVPAIAGSSGAAAELTTQMSALMAELSAEKARSAALEAELEDARSKAEIELQKVAAFWCALYLRCPVLPAPPRATCAALRHLRRPTPPVLRSCVTCLRLGVSSFRAPLCAVQGRQAGFGTGHGRGACDGGRSRRRRRCRGRTRGEATPAGACVCLSNQPPAHSTTFGSRQ